MHLRAPSEAFTWDRGTDMGRAWDGHPGRRGRAVRDERAGRATHYVGIALRDVRSSESASLS